MMGFFFQNFSSDRRQAPEKAGKMPELLFLCRREVWSRRSVAEKR